MKLKSQPRRNRHEDGIGLLVAFLVVAFAMIAVTAVAYVLMRGVEKVEAIARAREKKLTNNLTRAESPLLFFSAAVIPPEGDGWFEADEEALDKELNSVARWELRGATNLSGPWDTMFSFWGSEEFAREQAWRIARTEADAARQFWPDREVVGFVKWVRVE